MSDFGSRIVVQKKISDLTDEEIEAIKDDILILIIDSFEILEELPLIVLSNNSVSFIVSEYYFESDDSLFEDVEKIETNLIVPIISSLNLKYKNDFDFLHYFDSW